MGLSVLILRTTVGLCAVHNGLKPLLGGRPEGRHPQHKARPLGRKPEGIPS